MPASSKKIRVAINGFGRIGRAAFKIALENKGYQIVAINDLTDALTLAYLLQNDTVYGRYAKKVTATGSNLIVDKKSYPVIAQPDPAKLPWKKYRVDVVLECTGRFVDGDKAKAHLKAGAKRVILSAPAKGGGAATYLLGVNAHKYNEEKIISNASCTTNCLAPVAKVLHDNFIIEKGLMTTIHAYTNDQKVQDMAHPDLRRARAAAVSMIPTSTGAAKAISLVIPELKGKLDGFAIRVPVPNVSVVDLTCTLAKKTAVEEINAAFKEASEGKLKGILGFTMDPVVSVDFNHCSLSSIVDGLSTKILQDNFIKVLSWYDNEWGYSCRVVDLIEYIVKRGL